MTSAIGGPGEPDAVHPGTRLRGSSTWRELVRFLPEVGRLLLTVSGDSRVPWRAKIVTLGALAYVVSPLDLVPDVPVTGWIDDVWIVVGALRTLLRSAGYDVVREHWTGSDEGFALLLAVAGVEA